MAQMIFAIIYAKDSVLRSEKFITKMGCELIQGENNALPLPVTGMGQESWEIEKVNNDLGFRLR